MNEPAPGAATEPVTETRADGGIRADKDGRKWHAWVDTAGEEHWFAKTGGRVAVGSRYTAQVTRRDDGGISLQGTPSTPGRKPARRPGPPCRPSTPWPRPGSRRCAPSGTAARRSALDEAIAPLLELAAPLRTGAQRHALAACVIRKLCNSLAARKPPGGRQ